MRLRCVVENSALRVGGIEQVAGGIEGVKAGEFHPCAELHARHRSGDAVDPDFRSAEQKLRARGPGELGHLLERRPQDEILEP